MREWRARVYRKARKEKLRLDSKHWLSLRKRVFRRDKFMCQRCKSFFGENGISLQAHHIIPRPHGRTIIDNLVTLCNKCHDYIELNPQMLDEIDHIKIEKLKPKILDWHKWVYGGYARPSN